MHYIIHSEGVLREKGWTQFLSEKQGERDEEENKERCAVTYEDFCHIAEKMIENLPPKLFEQLNGGVNVVRQKKEDGEYVLMGEYVEDPIMGNTVYLYYGTFAEELKGARRSEWIEEIEETLLHELRHHVESLAGVDYLSFEEMQDL